MPENPSVRLLPTTQFGIHKLLTAVTVFAVVAAMIAPFFRNESPEALQKFLIFWTLPCVGHREKILI